MPKNHTLLVSHSFGHSFCSAQFHFLYIGNSESPNQDQQLSVKCIGFTMPSLIVIVHSSGATTTSFERRVLIHPHPLPQHANTLTQITTDYQSCAPIDKSAPPSPNLAQEYVS